MLNCEGRAPAVKAVTKAVVCSIFAERTLVQVQHGHDAAGSQQHTVPRLCGLAALAAAAAAAATGDAH